MATTTEIAQWMINTITSRQYEYQQVIVSDIEELFGREWVYENDNGNPAISPKVLAEFRKLHGGSIEWNKSERSWSI
ncbi:DUF6953 family protein [Nocardia sp. NPDC058705]|uniref:DUF6953 family protein n=1 Tax=Nocardia sp. NPDC058705 TaxID=3346609 RepID=UPI0036C20349